jgi:hypothetical protein
VYKRQTQQDLMSFILGSYPANTYITPLNAAIDSTYTQLRP